MMWTSLFSRNVAPVQPQTGLVVSWKENSGQAQQARMWVLAICGLLALLGVPTHQQQVNFPFGKLPLLDPLRLPEDGYKQGVGVGVQAEHQQAGISATAWPEEFTISFTTKNGSVPGFLAYDWGNKQQLIAHGANSTECLKYTQESCLLLFNTEGIYVILPSSNRCWLDVPGVGSLPPAWTTSGELVGDRYVNGEGMCRAFAYPPTEHLYMETIPGGLPCVFVFPDPDMTYYFVPESLVLGTPSPDYFGLPDYCSKGDLSA